MYMMPWFPIKDRGVVGMDCRQGQQHCVLFPGIFWLQLKHVSGFLLLMGVSSFIELTRLRGSGPFPALFTPFPAYPPCSLPSTHSVFPSVLPPAWAVSSCRTGVQAVSSTWKASCAASSSQLPPASLSPPSYSLFSTLWLSFVALTNILWFHEARSSVSPYYGNMSGIL